MTLPVLEIPIASAKGGYKKRQLMYSEFNGL